MNRNIILGLWPIAGITTAGVTEADAEATILAAIDHGITQFDTAFSYGYNGESDRLLGRCLGTRRGNFQIIGKVGQRWMPDKTRVNDASPKSLVADAEESLRRIGTDHFDTLMLHVPDDKTPIAQSASALGRLQSRGLCRRVGVCNVTVDQFHAFAAQVDCHALQCPLNLLQQDSLRDLIPACRESATDVYTFWTLMKGLLAGKIQRNHVFPPGDVRPKYPIFQGAARARAHQLLDRLQLIADESENTISQLSIGWAISQSGVTAALVGARYPNQIAETSQSGPLSDDVLARINQALET